MEAMTNSVGSLSGKTNYALIGLTIAFPWISRRQDAMSEAVVKGDSKIFAIACASVIAKVTKNRMMIKFHKK